MENTKLAQLEALSDIVKERSIEYADNYGIGDLHHILYAGNPDAAIIVAQMQPDKSDLYWAKKTNTHVDYVCTNPNGNMFKEKARSAKFNTEEDFCYINIIPFYSKGNSKYSEDAAWEMLWIAESLISILEPEIIICLGYQPFYYLTSKDKMFFEEKYKSLNNNLFYIDPASRIRVVPYMEDRFPYLKNLYVTTLANKKIKRNE